MIWNKSRRNIERIDTLIAHDVVISGSLEFSGGIQIDGCVKGIIRGVGEGSVIRISGKGRVEGDIHAPLIVINGVVHGSVYSSSHLELGVKSHITGDVHYELVEMFMGAEVNGQLVHETLGVQEKREPLIEIDLDMDSGEHDDSQKAS
jgi:cytoskeletal protein CcmA (bactofilin family)